MATKPTTLPEWASSVSADITDPGSSKKQTGWVAGGEKPPHDYFNWWQNLVYKWTQYLDAFLTDAHTWAGVQEFSNDVNIDGEAIINTLTVEDGSGTGAAHVTGTSALDGDVTMGGDLGLSSGTVTTAGLHVTGTPSFDISALHTVGGSGDPAFASGAANITGKPKTVFWKDASGAVHVQGCTGHSSATAWDVFTLPSGFRPPGTVEQPACDFTGAGGIGAVTVSSAGVVRVSSSGSTVEIGFHVVFRTDTGVA